MASRHRVVRLRGVIQDKAVRHISGFEIRQVDALPRQDIVDLRQRPERVRTVKIGNILKAADVVTAVINHRCRYRFDNTSR
jgi:hypothetical protein